MKPNITTRNQTFYGRTGQLPYRHLSRCLTIITSVQSRAGKILIYPMYLSVIGEDQAFGMPSYGSTERSRLTCSEFSLCEQVHLQKPSDCNIEPGVSGRCSLCRDACRGAEIYHYPYVAMGLQFSGYFLRFSGGYVSRVIKIHSAGILAG